MAVEEVLGPAPPQPIYIEAIERVFEAAELVEVDCETECRRRCSQLELLGDEERYRRCFERCFEECVRRREIARELGIPIPEICDICIPDRITELTGFILLGGRGAIDNVIVPAMQLLFRSCFCTPYGLVSDEFRRATGLRFPNWTCYTMDVFTHLYTLASIYYAYSELVNRLSELEERLRRLEDALRYLEALRSWVLREVEPRAPRDVVARIADTVLRQVRQYIGDVPGTACLERIAERGGTRRDLLDCLSEAISSVRRRLVRLRSRVRLIREGELVTWDELVSLAIALLLATSIIENMPLQSAVYAWLIRALPGLMCATRPICRREIRRRGVLVRVIEEPGFGCEEHTREVLRIVRRAIVAAARTLGLRV